MVKILQLEPQLHVFWQGLRTTLFWLETLLYTFSCLKFQYISSYGSRIRSSYPRLCCSCYLFSPGKKERRPQPRPARILCTTGAGQKRDVLNHVLLEYFAPPASVQPRLRNPPWRFAAASPARPPARTTLLSWSTAPNVLRSPRVTESRWRQQMPTWHETTWRESGPRCRICVRTGATSGPTLSDLSTTRPATSLDPSSFVRSVDPTRSTVRVI